MTRVCYGRYANCVWAREAAELLVDAVYGRQMLTPSGIHLQVLAISIIFGANLR